MTDNVTSSDGTSHCHVCGTRIERNNNAEYLSERVSLCSISCFNECCEDTDTERGGSD